MRAAGFETSEEAFEFSEFPARFGPSICGVLYAAGALFCAHLAFTHRMPGVAIVVLIGIAVATGSLGKFLLSGVLRFKSMRSSSVNLVARRPSGTEPGVWLVAHTDSKSQTIRMLFRVGSIFLTAIFFGLLLFSLGMQLLEIPASTGSPVDSAPVHVVSAALLTALAIIPLVLCFITDESLGALDNASGVAAVILAAELIGRDRNVGVLLSSGEELGLAGARAFLSAHAGRAGIALNCDTIDDTGRFVAMRHTSRKSSIQVMRRASMALGEQLDVRSLIRGILTDGVAFGEAGWDSWTLSRGNIGTLALVHTSKDRPERIVGTGIASAARILAATAEELS